MMAFAIFGSDSWGSSELAALFATHAACTGVGAYAWMRLARAFRTTRLLCVAGLLQCSMLVLLYGGLMPRGVFFGVAAVHGLAAGAVEPLYIGFNYLDKWGGGVQTAARRMGLVEPLRFAVQFLLTGMLASAGAEQLAAGAPPVHVQAVG
jgi:hypothetical protein